MDTMLFTSKKNTNYSYCTLFDFGFVHVGIVMIDSFLENNDSSKMYVLCMDDQVYGILSEKYRLDYSDRVITISLKDFMSDEISLIRDNRTWREFCWTCSALSIKYVFERYKEEICTYVDADLRFYADPDDLIDEMMDYGKSVQIVEHRFKMNSSGKRQVKESGRFCVEFNTFVNNKEGNTVLNDWIKSVLDKCSEDNKSGLGDQYYLDEWPDKYDCVHILQNPGAGIAPWNINRYKLVRKENAVDSTAIRLIYDKKTDVKAYFYHFTHISYYNENTVNINVFSRYYPLDKDTLYGFYLPYLKELKTISCQLGVTLNNKPGLKQKEKTTFMVMIMRIVFKVRELLNNNADFITIEQL